MRKHASLSEVCPLAVQAVREAHICSLKHMCVSRQVKRSHRPMRAAHVAFIIAWLWLHWPGSYASTAQESSQSSTVHASR